MSNTNLQTQTSSVLHNDTISSCSTSKVQEKTQLSRSRCMKSLREVKPQFKFLSETLQDFGTISIFKRTFSQDLDLLEQHLTKDILSQTDCNTTLTKLRTKFENAFNSEFKERMQKYTRFNAQSFQDAMIYNIDSIGKYMPEIILHQQRTPRSGNDTDADDVDIRPIYDEEPMAEVQLITECNIFAIGQQHTEQPEIINEGRVDHNKAKIKKEIDALETINIELEHSVATLLKENETLKKHYKDLYDSIKITRSKTLEQTTYLLANNADLKAQIQEKVFVIAALKNDLRKLKGNSVDTKFAKTSVLGKPILQSLRNQSVVRQPNAFKSERPQMFKPRNTMSTKVPTSDMISMMSMIELKSLFGPSFDEYFNGENQVGLKSPVVTTVDASDRRQQQPDSTSSTSTLASTITADGNINL
nr:hypothetical protein [Tanacetum cinerariifolium]